jgi:GWxTD domain-containing protein
MEAKVTVRRVDTVNACCRRRGDAGANLRILLRVAVFGVAGLVAGCGSSSEYPSGQTGGAYFYAPGTPRFEFQAMTAWEGQQSGISLRISLPNSSLVFLLEEGRYEARYEMIARLFDEEGERLLKEKVWPETRTVTRYAVTQVSQPSVSTYFLPSDEGRFLLRVSIRDENTGKSATLEQPVLIAPFHVHQPAIISAILEVLKKGEASFTPVIPPLMGRDYDSLRISCVAHSPGEGDQQTLRILVRTFPSDTSIASAPFLFSPIQGSFPVVGVDFSVHDTVAIIEHTLAPAAGMTIVHVAMPRLLEGFYRFTITLLSRSAVSGDTALTQSLDASIFSPGFPKPITIDDLVEPLMYIAGKNEIDTLKEVTDPREKKKRFDAFWLSEGANEQAAANAIRQYYTRVEEANRFFSTHKEGWRTDRGMIYIVLGPPVAVSHILQKEVWFYSNAEQDPVNTYVFTQAQIRAESQLLRNYILNRQTYYESTWQRALERWRRAAVF